MPFELPSHFLIDPPASSFTSKKVKLAPLNYTLADFVKYLDKHDSVLIKYISKNDLQELIQPSEYTQLPVYSIREVFFDSQKENPVYMVFVANGQILYSNGDILTDYKLDEAKFYDYINHPTLTPNEAYHFTFSNDVDALKEWAWDYNYDAICEAFYLDGSGDLASFAGFFFLND